MAGNTIAQAYVQILPTTQGIQSELTSALAGPSEAAGQAAGSSVSKGMQSGLGTVGKIAAGAFAAVTTAAVAATGAIVKGTGEVAAYGDNIDKMSQKMGMSATAYQEWDAIMQHSGTSIDAMQRGMTTLSKAVEEDSAAFAELGLSLSDVQSMSQEELFSATITALQNMEAGTERTVLAQQLLGGSAKELGALLNTSAEDTDAMRQRVHELGGVMSDEAVKAAAAYQDTLQDMGTAFSSLKRNLVSEFLPGVTTVMSGLTELMSGNGGGAAMITEGISGITQKVTEELPKFLEMGMQIVRAVGDAILQNLPALFECGLQIIMTLADALIEALPDLIPAIVDIVLEIVDKLTDPDTVTQLLGAAVKIMLALAEGLMKAIPQLIAKVPEIIMNLVSALLQAAPQLLKAGAEMMRIYAEGITNGISAAIKSVSDLGRQIKQKFEELRNQARQWGRDLIQKFIDGLKEKIAALKDTVKNIASAVKRMLGFSEPEEGPLSDFHTYAPDMMKLFARGIRDNEQLVRDQIAKSLSFGDAIASGATLGAARAAVGAAGSAGSATASQPILLTAILQLDGTELARKTYSYNLAEAQRHGMSLINA